MLKFLPAFLIIASCHCCFLSTAQSGTLNCGNGRYINDVFTTVTKTQDVVFGYNTSTDYTTSTVYNHDLKLDFYQPASDVATKRPLIILAFGGSFIGGQRSDLDAVCTAFAKKGYAVATIDYRLIEAGPNNANINLVYSNPALLADQIIKNTGDMKAAIRLFKHDAVTANIYKIDPSKIFVGGFSAGAIIALQTAYTDDVGEIALLTPVYANNGGLEGNTDFPAPNNLLPAFNSAGIAGVINIAGGVVDTSLVDATNPPLYSAQGSADGIIPYNYGNAYTSSVPLFGSHLIQARANNIGLPNQLFTVAGGAHESPVTEPYLSQVIAGVATFFEPLVCTAIILPVRLQSFTVSTANCSALLRWQIAAGQQGNYYDIETSTDGTRFTRVGTVADNSSTGGRSYTYQYDGPAGTSYFRLKMAGSDGSFAYSPVQKLTLSCNSNSIKMYPNPMRNYTTVTGLKTGMHLSLTSAAGTLLWAQKAPGYLLQIPLTAFANGLYFLKITDASGGVVMYSRLIKQ